MLNRRRFLAASVIGAVTATLPVQPFAATPLRATPKHRRLFPKREEGGSWLFHSDAPYEPRKVIRPDAIERVFGEGAFNRLSQRDHWAMIEAGWFSGPDLHLPVPLGDPTYDVWKGYYHPVTEAHDLLRTLFAAKYRVGLRWGDRLPNGLSLAEHPCTPRYATARVYSDFDLLRCLFDVASMGPLIEVVLPEDLRPLMAQYDDPIRRQELICTMPNPNAPKGLTLEEKLRRASQARPRTAPAQHPSTN